MMPSFRQKFVGFIRQLSNSSESARDDAPENPSDCFIQNYLKGSEKTNKNEPVILHGKKPYEIPPLNIGDYETTEIKAGDTGPDGGLVTVNKKKDPNANNTIAGTDNWANPHLWACGQSCSLYEVHPVTQLRAGDPIADCYGVLVREDTAILCLADGVNWGVKASVAAKAAVHGCMDYLNTHLFCDASPKPSSTTDVFTTLLRSFHAAHTLILQEKGMLTTLTAAVILPLQNEPGQYVVCTCNVGDSLAYVFSPKHGVREITQGSHDVHQMRDMRDALGALGPVDGQNPELSNLTLSLTQAETGDIVFLTSDGVSDNLDPVVGKFTGLPTVEAHQRHKLLLLRTEDLLRYGVSGKGPPVSSARDTVSLLLDFVVRLTAAKRHILEDKDLYNTGPEGSLMSPGEQVSRRREICKRLHAIPGKLDHASVAAYVVGKFNRVAHVASEDDRVYEEVKDNIHLNKEVKESVQSNDEVESVCSDGEKTKDMVSKESSTLDKDAREVIQNDISEAFNKNTKNLYEDILKKSSKEVDGKEKKYFDIIDVCSSEGENSETGRALNVEHSDVNSLVFIDGESDEETVEDGKESVKEMGNSNETVNESDVQNNNRLEGKENRSHSNAKTPKETGERVERSSVKSDASTGSSVSNEDRTSNVHKVQDKRDRRAKDRRTRRNKDNPSKES